jgi:(S)-mandelate dehydrogenase
MASVDRCFNVNDMREEARRRLPKFIFEFIDRGNEDELSIANNRAAWQGAKLRNRVMVNIADRNLGTKLFGKELSFPLAIAPTGAAGLCWYEGELELARAAAAKGIPFTLATASQTRLEKLAENSNGQLWFQIYLWRQRELSYDLVKRARDAGFGALVVTVDFALGVLREYNLRNGFRVPYKPSYRSMRDMLLRPGWMTNVLLRYLATTGMPRNVNFPEIHRMGVSTELRAETLAWDDIHRLRDIWQGPLIVKGIMRPDDAEAAVQAGADGIIVSNHGGRNMDSAGASFDALPEVVDAVGHRTTVLVDSGVTRGSDIVKALAYGAKAVLIGKAALYGTAAGGQAGAERTLLLLRNEFEKTMGFVGCRTVADITPDVLSRIAAR